MLAPLLVTKYQGDMLNTQHPEKGMQERPFRKYLTLSVTECTCLVYSDAAGSP